MKYIVSPTLTHHYSTLRHTTTPSPSDPQGYEHVDREVPRLQLLPYQREGHVPHRGHAHGDLLRV